VSTPLRLGLRAPFRNVVSIASGTVVGQGALALASPLLTRLYRPEAFGLLGLLTAFVGVAAVAVTWRLEMAIPVARTGRAADRLLAASLLVILPSSLIATCCLIALQLGGWLGYGNLPLPAAVLAYIALVVTGAFTALRFWAVRENRFKDIGTALAAQGLARALIPGIAWFLDAGWTGLAIGDIVGRMLGIFRLGRAAARRLRAAILGGRRRLLAEVRRNRRYALILLPSSLADAIAGSIPLPVIATLFGVRAAGEYALIMRVASAPGALVAAAVADVFHARVTAWLRDEPRAAEAAFLRLASRLALISVGLYVPAALLAPRVFGLIFGDAWRGAGVAFSCLSPFLIAGLIVSPLTRVLTVTGHMQYKLFMDLLLLLVPALTLYWAGQTPFHHALAEFAVVNAALYGAYFTFLWRSIHVAARRRDPR
jgi:O-antigen/teichoic acid export membrane protein